MRTDSHVWPKLVVLADCLCAEITASVPPVCFCGVLPGGQLVLDWCGCDGDACGMAWVRITGIVPNLGSATATTVCLTTLRATIEVGIARCAPTLDDQGNPPGVAEQLAAAEQQAADMAAMLRAILCCDGIDQHAVGLAAYSPFQTGDCLGGTWTFTVDE